MTAFEVFVNDRRITVAGVGQAGVLSSIVTWTAGASGAARRVRNEDLFLQVGGLSRSSEYVDWAQRTLRVGDEVRIRIVKRRTVDRPRKRRRRDPDQETREKERYVRKVADELGWKIQTRPARR